MTTTIPKFAHLQIPLLDVLNATNNFHENNIIRFSESGVTYKGRLLRSGNLILIAAKRLLFRKHGQGDDEFWTEVSMLSDLKHPNIVSIVGFCDEKHEKIIVTRYAAKGNLKKRYPELIWRERLKISVGLARALSYLYYDESRDYSVIHGNIKSSTILLDGNLKPKLSGFKVSIKHSKPVGTKGYFDPEIEKNKGVTYKSDVYLFGVVLFEILCVRRAFNSPDGNRLLAPWAIDHYENGKLHDIIDPYIRNQMSHLSLQVYSKTAYSCLKEMQTERPPHIIDIVDELEKALRLQLRHENRALRLQLRHENRAYNQFAHLEIQHEEIVSATNNFAPENLITEGGFGKGYKGQLLRSGQLIDIYARRLDGQGDNQFWTEISMLSSLQHENIITIFGFCEEDDEKIIIYEHAIHGSLDQHLSDPNLTWFQRLKICLGVARGLSYIHYDVIHCDLVSSKIVLDKDWEPKIFGFEHSTKYPQSWRHRLLFSHNFYNPNMTPKYDVYCFGVLLFEILYGMKPTKTEHGVKVEQDDIINPNLRKQMDRQSLGDFKKIVYNCLSEYPVQRPTMDDNVKKLEDVWELQCQHENIEHSPSTDEGTSSKLLKMKWMKIPLSEIRAATKDFNEAHFVASGGYGSVYKAELDIEIHNLSIEGEWPNIRTRTTVAIKRIKKKQDEDSKQGFLTEIELLTSCKHPNIISLLGFCVEADDIILVYEYASKGSLSDYLGSTCKNINLTWAKRIQICLDIAHGIKYLHTDMEGKPRIIHRDIKSENILLDENLNAKVADFGLSKFQPTNQQASTIHTIHLAGTEFYVDPEYQTSFKYKKESDVYSFGVVLFEMLSGRLAYDPIYTGKNDKGLAPIARRHYNEGTLKELIDPRMVEEDDEHIVILNRGPNQESFEAFSRIAYQCLAETQAKRPTMEDVIKELQTALNLQEETMVLSRFRMSDISNATEKFSKRFLIGFHEYGKVYKAELDDFENKSSLPFKEKNDGKWQKRLTSVAIKCFSSSVDVKQRFFSEIVMRTSYKHPNMVSLLGFCDEGDKLILVYEHASNNSLHNYVKTVDKMGNLTWRQRLHMCLGIAHGLNHLHTKMGSQKRTGHGDIRSANILLGKNLEPKIAYFGISKFHLANQEESSRQVYWDPEFEKSSLIKKESDIYSFGVILFEIFCGSLANDPYYTVADPKGLVPYAWSHFNNKSIEKLIDPKLFKKAIDDDILTSNIIGPNQDSVDTFLKIAYQCVEETQAKRPSMETLIKQLEIALDFQENRILSLEISLKDIMLATENFSVNCFGSGRYWKAYEGKLPHASTTIVAKRWDSKSDDQFGTELDILFKRKHKNIIRLVGYCSERNENIIVYEHMSKGSLDKYLKDSKLKWMKRLQICIDVASALDFLHGENVTLKKVVHRNIKSHSILLNDDWDAKISNFELSSLDSLHQNTKYIYKDAYLDPQYNQGSLTEKSDIYSFGVILFEILCGRLTWEEGHEAGPLAKHYYEQAKLDEMVFADIKEQIVPQSLTTFVDIAYECIHEDADKRPKASDVVIQLKKALEIQEDFEIWEPKLPRDYKEIMGLSQTPEIYHTKEKKDLYEKLSGGIVLPKGKVWYILSNNGESNKMISVTAAKFTYKNHQQSHKFRSIHISRFQKVAKILDISNLKIQVSVDNRLLSPDVTYGIYLVFKISDPRIFSRNCMFMNLKYKNGTETLHSYFATWRDNDWMMIELHRFLNHKEDVSFTFLLESFSKYYCTSGAIFIEGIEFQAIKNMAHENNKNQKKVQQLQKSNSDLEKLLTVNEKMYLRELNGKKHLMLSATEVLYNSEKWNPFRSKSSADSSFRPKKRKCNNHLNHLFQNVMELLPQQVFRIKYKIKVELLSPFTEYTCYLVFKVSEKCRGLHCPVKVRNLLHRKNKENQIIYFRTPSRLNHHDDFWVPEQRKDGWMEVMIWKFNSKYNNKNLGKDVVPMNLKLVTYEGTMWGLIICGLEFRPT